MKYIIKFQEENKIKTIILSEECFHNRKLPNNIIEIKKKIDLKEIVKRKKSIPEKTILHLLYELNLMLDANILLNKAFDILIDSKKDEQLKSFLYKLKYSFSNHKNLLISLNEYNISSFVISLFKIIQDTGNAKENISTLYEILKEEYELKKQIKKIFAYPIILLVSFVLALFGMFKLVIPKFEYMFVQNNLELPLSTKILFFTKQIFENHILTIISLFLIFISFFYFMYEKNSSFKFFIHKLLFSKIYLISDIYKYRLLYRHFYIMNTLLSNKYEFHESIIKSKTLINNKYFLDRITRIDSLLKSGKSVYQGFDKANIFDEVVLNIIKTAEISNSLVETSEEIKTIYKKRFNERIEIFSLFIEPVFFLLIMGLIVWIIMAIFVPLWSMGDILKI